MQYLVCLLLFMCMYAGLYVKQRRYDLSEFFYTDCLKKRTAVLGPQHPATLHTLCNLAHVYTQLVSTLMVCTVLRCLRTAEIAGYRCHFFVRSLWSLCTKPFSLQ
jgi:hypothetical protein